MKPANPDPATALSWSLSWVSVVGNSTPPGQVGISIYQGGFAKCDNLGSCPYNGGQSYYWYFYGHPSGTGCGSAYNSGVIKVKGNAGPGQLNYKVAAITLSGVPKWAFWIDHVRYNTRPAADLDVCWPSGGPSGIQVMNEMLDNNDQNGGTVGNHEDFDFVEYKTSGGWNGMNWPLSSNCDANSYPAHWDCTVSSINNDTFKNWDDRAP